MSSPPPFHVVLSSCLLYVLFSSSLLLLNKSLMAFLPPAPILALQTVGTVAVLAPAYVICPRKSLECCGDSSSPSPASLSPSVSSARSSSHPWGPSLFSAATLKPYTLHSLLFLLGLLSSMLSLRSSPVDALIVFRSTSPILVSLVEARFLSAPPPPPPPP
eukprot:CAMPEP_0182481882 /NCGR_PEP_ID=MMETSP1319-20130603/38058_1 /TAXON_ID=172717 /ORGANISM="Bolidomonas pacifica, Strain RCC208" /LENGTH=160 /DNA_ID=CAMNT_0024683535 /DNA_START=277 /DNA_END=755 /DNA_ORIENTATION=+